jgi:hypothetical protein
MTKLAFNPALEAAKARARELAAPAAEHLAVWPPVKPRAVKPPRVQFLVRLTVEARAAIRAEADRQGLTETDLVERYALGLAKAQ